ncbi:MAG: energy transducer TonB [Candidatus Binataceae bacterium]
MSEPHSNLSDDATAAATRAATRHAAAFTASLLAHAALLAVIIWLLPSPLPRPTQWVLAYFIELGPAGGQGARSGASGAPIATPDPPNKSARHADARRPASPAPIFSLVSPPVSNSVNESVNAERDSPTGSAPDVATATFGERAIGAASNGSPAGGGSGATSHGAGAGGGDAAGIEVASADYARNPLPRYPDYARRHAQQGTVTLRVLVADDGSVRAAMVAESSGFETLDDAALVTVRDRWRFAPARRAGAAVESWVLVPIRFALTDSRVAR